MNDPHHPFWAWLETATYVAGAAVMIWLGADSFDGEWKSVAGIAVLFFGHRGYKELKGD